MMKLHWHAHSVHCVAYSSDGSYVASGGEEFVLVLWHLESGRRQHIPRLSAVLTSIATAVNGGGYFVACQDNSILYYHHVTQTHVWQTGGLARLGLSSSKTLINHTLVAEPWSDMLVVQGTSLVGDLQFYAPLQDRVTQTLALTERNQISRVCPMYDTYIYVHTYLYLCGGRGCCGSRTVDMCKVFPFGSSMCPCIDV
jgi:NET1-associated nuclear protein 1 (U3 small nucleolar RNA-associated protein 17)